MGSQLATFTLRSRFALASIIFIAAQAICLGFVVAMLKSSQDLIVDKVSQLNESVESFSSVTKRLYDLNSSVQLLEKTYLHKDETLTQESLHVDEQLRALKELSDDANFQEKMDVFIRQFNRFIGNSLSLNKALSAQHESESALQLVVSGFLKNVTDQKLQYGVGDRFFQVFKASTEIRNNLEAETERRFMDNLQKILATLIKDMAKIDDALITGDLSLREQSVVAAENYYQVNSQVKVALMQRPKVAKALKDSQSDLIEFVSVSKEKARYDALQIEQRLSSEIGSLTRIMIVVALVLFFTTAIIFGLLIYRHISTPVKKISASIKRFAEGDYSEHLLLERDDEWNVVENAFNDMADTVRQKHEELTTERINYDYLAHHDSLTGLPNRLQAYNILQRLVEQGEKKIKPFSVIYLDLDEFKQINDSFGHLYGDKLLVQVAKLLKLIVGDSGTAARLGGDEFMIILDDLKDYQQVNNCADQILDRLSNPVLVDDSAMNVGASIGICHFPEHGRTVDDLVRNSDTAMYYSKKRRGVNTAIYRDEMTENVVDFMSISAGIRRALENDEFVLYYQPCYRLDNLHLQGFEVLIRWQNPGQGLVMPDLFLPVAEQAGLMGEVDSWVFKHTVKQVISWQEQGIDTSNLKIMINFSGKKFSDPNLLEELDSVLNRYQFPAHQIELEITEQEIMTSVDNKNSILQGLSNKGFSLAIDDFGTGYSSFNYLKNLTLNTLKIDRSFTRDIETSEKDLAIVKTILSLANMLNLSVVAEGIETVEQLNLLKSHGCTSGQGYFLARPMTVDDAYELLLDKTSITA